MLIYSYLCYVRNQQTNTYKIMKTLNVLQKALENGLSNNELVLVANGLNMCFADYVGANNANGKHDIFDQVPAGLFIYGVSNFISIPDTVFDGAFGKVAFYEF